MLTTIKKLLASLILNLGSECLQSGSVPPLSCGYLSHLCSIGASLPLTRETISICLPCLICLGLPQRRLHQKEAGNLKAPSLHLSHHLSLFCSHPLFLNLFLCLLRSDKKFGVVNTLSLAHKKKK